ncbi:CFA_G0004510.mRNA.1.CDS.1 [Saccharomyces cerevisiae]|nr:CFA_G0004510.mRNA.1.CDS.1 [Saccharomyces cerevisiae]CAI7158886.1 CFA_G0004510.mRNA.1.CDS.1 [Saccharomyces cerevisiae]
MKFTLEDQVVLITGGSQGLGKEFAKKYYNEAENTKIIIVSRSEARLLDTCNEIRIEAHLRRETTDEGQVQHKLAAPLDLEQRLFYYPCDLSCYESVECLFNALRDLDLLPTQTLCCAGGAVPKLFRGLSGHELKLGMDINYKTTLNVAHQIALAEQTKEHHLIIFSSATALYPFVGYSQYAPAKAAIKSLVAILRQELTNFRISCVYPGNFESEGFTVEQLTKPEITKLIEGPSDAIPCKQACDIIAKSLARGDDDVFTDFVGWMIMGMDLGLTAKKSRFVPLQWIFGVLSNILVVPFYMVGCSWYIRKWFRENDGKKAN